MIETEAEVNLETHKILKRNNSVIIYRKWNNPNEIITILVDVVKMLAHVLFIIFGLVTVFQKPVFSLSFVLVIFLIMIISWSLFRLIKLAGIDLRNLISSRLIIDDLSIVIENGISNKNKIEVKNVRAVKGKIYSEIRGNSPPKFVYHAEIMLNLIDGNHVIIDTINSSKFFRPIEADVVNELKSKSKKIGKLIAEELNVQFFLENKVINQ